MQDKTRWLVTCAVAIIAAAGCTTEETVAATPPEETGGAEAPADEPIACGGFAGIPCPDGYDCVDDPNDDCDPLAGGADCMGVCRLPEGATSDEAASACAKPGRQYVDSDPDNCARIRFACEPGKAPFFDDCGCGCEPAPES